jgi:hypothetical protein
MQDSNYGEERNKLEELLQEISRLSQSRIPESRNRAAQIQVHYQSPKIGRLRYRYITRVQK